MKQTLLLLFLGISTLTIAQNQNEEALKWAKEQYEMMTIEERIGQLFHVRAHSNWKPEKLARVTTAIKEHHIGGLCFFQGTPEKQIEQINEYQKMSKYPLLISCDAEWGVGMRFKKDGFSFPKQLTIGATKNEDLVYKMGVEVAKHLKATGVQVNFAPVVDINNNAKNPVINTRSFGEDKISVAAKGWAYAKGMQDNGVIACLKHFPGHGDTDVDSHYDLPVIKHDRKRLDSIELFPFKELTQRGVSSVMVAHLSIPSIDNTPNLPTTLSPKLVNDILLEQYNYKGLVFTDALDMKGVAKYHKNGQAELKAFLAGNDCLLLPENIPNAVRLIKAKIADGTVTEERMQRSVLKILKHKYLTGLHDWKPLDKHKAREIIFSENAKSITRDIFRNAITVVKNQNNLIPIQNMNQKMVAVAMGINKQPFFQTRLNSFVKIPSYQLDDAGMTNLSQIEKSVKDAEVVLVSFHDMSDFASKKYKVNQKHVDLARKWEKEWNKKVIISIFGTPYALEYFTGFNNIIESYQEKYDTQDLTAQGIFGALSFRGSLPIHVNDYFPLNSSIITANMGRTGYESPTKMGMNEAILNRIDSVAKVAIDIRATPGCVVLVSKGGKIVYEKAYGYHTYQKQTKMHTSNVFDVASITKVAATTVSLMKLQEMGKIDVKKTLGEQLSIAKQGNKSYLVLEDILRHEGKLTPWLRFYQETLVDPKTNPVPSPNFYKTSYSEDFPHKVASNLYLKKDHRNEMLKQIVDSPLRSKKEYKYSDLGMIMMDKLIEEKTGMRVHEFAYRNFYLPLEMQRTTFNAADVFSLNEIPPTEMDTYFRQQKIQGYVHDMAASMTDGISGHAGLFSTARDLNSMFTMLLNNGIFNGTQLLKSETIDQFTQRSNNTRRGIGFDMKQLDEKSTINMSPMASDKAFGHLGFTGTAVWADPAHDLVYVFLSNRTFPDMKNNKLGKEDIRPKIQTIVYESLMQSPLN